MLFLNGESSPYYEVKNTEGDLEGSMEIDESREIRFVSMGLRGGLMYTGITFYDEAGDVIATQTWSENEFTKETPKYEIPIGQKIVGMKCSTAGGNFVHLSFLLANKDVAKVVGELRFPPIEEYPTVDDFEKLYSSDFRISAISYKQFSDFYSLSGI